MSNWYLGQIQRYLGGNTVLFGSNIAVLGGQIQQKLGQLKWISGNIMYHIRKCVGIPGKYTGTLGYTSYIKKNTVQICQIQLFVFCVWKNTAILLHIKLNLGKESVLLGKMQLYLGQLQ